MTDTPEAELVRRGRLIRLNAAFGAMPYGGIAHFQFVDVGEANRRATPTAEEALDVAIDNLERLARVLAGAAERHEAEHKELERYRRWVASAGELADAIRAAEDRRLADDLTAAAEWVREGGPSAEEAATVAQGDTGVACPCGGRMLEKVPGNPAAGVACPRCGKTPLDLVRK